MPSKAMGLHPESSSGTLLFSPFASGIIAIALAVPAFDSPYVVATGANRFRVPHETTQAGLDSNPQPAPQRDSRARRDRLRPAAFPGAGYLHAHRPFSRYSRRAIRRGPGCALGSTTAGACPQLDRHGRRMAGGRHPADHRHRSVSAAHPSGPHRILLGAPASRRLGHGPPPRPGNVDDLRTRSHRTASAHLFLAECTAHRGRHRTPAGRLDGALPEPARRDHRTCPAGGNVAVSGHHVYVPHCRRVGRNPFLHRAADARAHSGLAHPARSRQGGEARP